MKFLDNLNDLPQKCKVAIYGLDYSVRKIKSLIEKNRKDVEIIYHSFYNFGSIEPFLKNLKGVKGQQIYNHADLLLIATEDWFLLYNNLNESEKEKKCIVINPLLFNEQIVYSQEEFDCYGKYFERVKRIFDSDLDVMLYDLVLKVRFNNPENLVNLDKFLKKNLKQYRKQYLDFINPEVIRSVIEGGVYDGKATVDFVENFPGGVRIYGFEPFIEAFDNGKYKQFFQGKKNVKIYREALWSKNDTLKFAKNAEDEQASRIVGQDGEKEIWNISTITITKATSIDNFVENNSIKDIDFIKLDIEGAELMALKGAIKTLKKFRPQFAVSIYHSKKDLFEIPLFLRELFDNYIFKLGHYSNYWTETVLYGIPEELNHHSI